MLQLQSVTSPLPAFDEVPAGQSSHWLWFVLENFPTSQVRQADMDVLPVPAAYLPAPQSEHAADPSCMNLPGTQAVHVAFATSVKYPSLQKHECTLALPVSDDEKGLHAAQSARLTAADLFEYVFSGQSTQEVDVAFLYLPMLHAAHVPPAGPL